MSTRYDELMDQYEDALFALLMDNYIEEEGKRLLAENERLKNDPAAAVPEDVCQRCLKTIRREFARRDRQSAGRVALRVLNRVAVAAVICVLLFTAAFAVSPKLRSSTLNLLVEMFDEYTTLNIGNNRGEQPAAVDNEQLLLGYRLPAIPEGFAFDRTYSDYRQAQIQYVNDDGATIRFNISKSDGGDSIVDTEDAQAERILIHGYDGMIIEKQYEFDNDFAIDSVLIVWGDTQQNTFISVQCDGIGRETALQLARGIEFESESP